MRDRRRLDGQVAQQLGNDERDQGRPAGAGEAAQHGRQWQGSSGHPR